MTIKEIQDNLNEYRYHIAACAAVVIIVFMTIVTSRRPPNIEVATGNQVEVLATPTPTPTPTASPPVATFPIKSYIYLEITGYIRKPGVYEVDRELRVIDLIKLAGGVTSDANMIDLHSNISLSLLLKDGQKVFIGDKSNKSKITQVGNDSSQASKPTGQKGIININTATKEDLMTLTGIGDSTAQKIIDARPFESIEELKNVSGIGESKFNSIVSFVEI